MLIAKIRNKKTRITAHVNEVIIDGEFSKFHVIIKQGRRKLGSEEFYCKTHARRYACTEVFAPIVN